jgi:hypothetical protein
MIFRKRIIPDMPLLRIIFYPNVNHWDAPKPNPKQPDFTQIIKKWFPERSGEQPSLYEAVTPLAEIETVAAFSLPNPDRVLEAGYLLRIEWRDFAALDIQPADSRPGKTGVVGVDFRHWEIPGDEQLIARLVRHLWHRTEQGEDRFRWVGCQLQAAAMRRFLDADSRSVIDEAKRCCRHKLSGEKVGRRTPGRVIQQELAVAPPNIPAGRIRKAAYERYVQRCTSGECGNEETDWLEAEQDLRARYHAEITGYQPPPSTTPRGVAS